MAETKEPQYQILLDLARKKGLARLGLMTNQVWHDDPRRLVFLLARYKFCAKMLSGRRRVLEVGCGDGFGSRLLLQEVGSLTVVDFDPLFIEDIKQRAEESWRMECRVHDMTRGPADGSFDGAVSLDVLEHISPAQENAFMTNLCACLEPHAVVVIGTPSLNSQAYASPQSKEGHVNCKDHRQLLDLMGRHFHNVFLFSMNDEVVHTGFYPLAHYYLALAVDPRGR